MSEGWGGCKGAGAPLADAPAAPVHSCRKLKAVLGTWYSGCSKGEGACSKGKGCSKR